MAAYTFPIGEYPAVRAAIGLDVDEIMLPDSTLDLSVYKGEAERYIMRALTDTQYENPAWTSTVNEAAILYLASLATPRLRIITSERIAGGNLSYAAIDLQAISTRLLEQAGQRIAEIQSLSGIFTDTPDNPTYFGKGQRILTY